MRLIRNIMAALILSHAATYAQNIIITSISQDGKLSWSSPLTNSVHLVEWTSSLGATNKWSPLLSIYVTNTTTTVDVPTFYRVTAITNKDPVVGLWNWFSGDKVRFYADGTLTKTNVANANGVWQRVTASAYLLYWGQTNIFIDNLTLSTNSGTTFNGYNQVGNHVTGTRIGP